MNIFSFSSICIFISNIIIATLLFFKGGRRKITMVLGFFCVVVAMWGVGAYKFSSTEFPNVSVFWRRVANIGVIFAPILHYHFIYVFLKLRTQLYHNVLRISYFLGFIFITLNFSFPKEWFVGDVRLVFSQFYYIDWWVYKNLIYLFFYLSFYWLLLFYSFFLLLYNYPKYTGIEKEQVKYFILGSIIAWIGPTLMWLIEFHVYIYPYSNFLIAFYPAIWAYAIIKHRLMDIRVAITRTGIFLFVYGIVLGLPFYLGYKTNSWQIVASTAVALATIGPFIYRWLKIRTDAIILKEEQTFQQYLQYLGREAVYVKSNDELSAVAAKSYNLKEKPYMDFLALYLFDQKAGEYKLKVNQGQNYDFDQALASDSQLVKALIEKRGDCLLEDELKKQKLLKAAVILPLWQKQEEKLLGFLVLGAKYSNLAYTFNDLTALSNFAYQIMLGLTNIEFLETRRKEDAEFFRQEKLRSLGTMAGMMGHQISNRLGVIQKEVECFAMNPAFIQARNRAELDSEQWNEILKSFLGIMKKLLGETKQANKIIEALVNYSRATDITFKSIDLAQVVLANPVEIVKIKHHQFFEQYPDLLEFKIEKDLPLINGNQAMLGELLINLLSNAVDAVEERIKKQINLDRNYQPNIFVKINAVQTPIAVEVVIEDNGIGMAKEVQDKIFVPFFTTKATTMKGTGWGLYVINMIIEKHHGRLKVESEYGKGTKFTLTFFCMK